jgi:hypothetical protein
MVEANVFRVYLIGLGNADRDAASAAYHVPHSFKTKLDMAERQVKDGTLAREFDAELKKYCNGMERHSTHS